MTTGLTFRGEGDFLSHNVISITLNVNKACSHSFMVYSLGAIMQERVNDL